MIWRTLSDCSECNSSSHANHLPIRTPTLARRNRKLSNYRPNPKINRFKKQRELQTWIWSSTDRAELSEIPRSAEGPPQMRPTLKILPSSSVVRPLATCDSVVVAEDFTTPTPRKGGSHFKLRFGKAIDGTSRKPRRRLKKGVSGGSLCVLLRRTTDFNAAEEEAIWVESTWNGVDCFQFTVDYQSTKVAMYDVVTYISKNGLLTHGKCIFFLYIYFLTRKW